MPRNRKQSADDSPEGAPEWMVTFSDCMTLLLTFFVLLLSFAGFAENTLEGLGSSFANALPSVAASFVEGKESLWEMPQINKTEKILKGSETPTLVERSTGNFMKQRRPLDFRNLRVFTIPSDDFFHGKGSVITPSGKKVLDQLAQFLIRMSARVVISENGPGDDGDLGLNRAWQVLQYLAAVEKLDRDSFSITRSSTMVTGRAGGRMLEITLLERDIYE